MSALLPRRTKQLPFQSALPVRGAIYNQSRQHFSDKVSIRAPREGSDLGRLAILAWLEDVSIRAPREGSDCARHNRFAFHSGFNPRSP